MYNGKSYWFFNSGAKSNFDSITNATAITDANWKHMLSTWGIHYCLNTDKVDTPPTASSITV
jgi:hypothetical protein